MPTIQDPGVRTEDGPISFADVLACIPTDEDGVLQADATNAGAIRNQLGRGSTSTVQRHLDAIRAELAAALLPTQSGAIPQAPVDAVSAIWSAAWSAAQRETLARLDRVTTERDAAQHRVEVLTADRDAAINDADEQRLTVAHVKYALDEATAILTQRETELTGQLERSEADLKAQIERSNAERLEAASELAQQREQFEQATKLALANWEIERRTMQAQIDKLQERVAELRALEIWAAGQAAPKSPS